MLNMLRSLLLRFAHAAIPILACLHVSTAQATLITFDDLPSPAPGGSFDDVPITDQYASLGVVFSNAFLATSPNTFSPPNFLLGGQDMRISFIDTLPTFVSVRVNSTLMDQLSITAFGPSGLLEIKNTSGFTPFPETSTPYIPNEFVSFTSPGGISALSFNSFFFLRIGPQVDNLDFRAVAPVPEPASVAMLGVGVLMLLGWRRRTRL